MNLDKANMMFKDLVNYYCGTEIKTVFNNRLQRALGRAKGRRNRMTGQTEMYAIELNTKFVKVNHEIHVLDTILHEIAHVLTPGCKHNPTWHRKAKELGCDLSKGRFAAQVIRHNETDYLLNNWR